MQSLHTILKYFVIRGFILFLPVIYIGVDDAYCVERTYYSIHLASFKKLRNANEHINALKKKGKVVFWKKADVPGKGEYYRVYLGRYNERSRAVEFWQKLKKEGAVSYFGVHKFRETVEPIKIKELPPIVVPEKKDEVVQASPQIRKEDRFVDNQDGTITDRVTDLMWIKNGWRIDFFSALNWLDATKKCENFRLGGYSDWRLPTVNEWKSVLDAQKESPALIEPNPFENIIVHMPYWSKTEFTYGSGLSGITKNPPHAFTVMLYFGRLGHQNKNKMAFILPVRSMKQSTKTKNWHHSPLLGKNK